MLLELRGNVPTRIERLQRGDYDAIVLAAAGLTRLGPRARTSSEYLRSRGFPAGGVAGRDRRVRARRRRSATLRWLAALDDAATRLAASAERALLAHLEGGCQVPLGALAQLARRDARTCSASVCALDGSQRLVGARGSRHRPHGAAQAAALGQRASPTSCSTRGAAALIAQRARERTPWPGAMSCPCAGRGPWW